MILTLLKWKKHKKFSAALLVLCLSGVSLSCSYRFSYKDNLKQIGLNQLSVEAIYDTSYDIIPHDILWQEVQREIARRSYLHLTTVDQSDVYIRLHLNRSHRTQHQIEYGEEIKDPKQIISEGKVTKPSSFRNKKQAEHFAKKEKRSISINVEALDLRLRKRIFNKNYKMISDLELQHPLEPPNSKAIRIKENYEKDFQSLSKILARKIVNDIVERLR